jgi:hypothetical protein
VDHADLTNLPLPVTVARGSQHALFQPKAKEKHYLREGEVLVMKTDITGWHCVRLIRHTRQYNWASLYWYWEQEESHELGEGFLHQGEDWGVLCGEDIHLKVATVNFVYLPSHMCQVDGHLSTPDSLTPDMSPDTTVTKSVSVLPLLPPRLGERLKIYAELEAQSKHDYLPFGSPV